MDATAVEDIKTGNRITESSDPQGKRRVAYFYDNEIGNYNYGKTHPMKPHRVRMANQLIVNYDLHKYMDVFRPHLCNYLDLMHFHADDYINFLRIITPENRDTYSNQLARFNVGDDCPIFDGLFDYIRTYTSGSIGGACRLNEGLSDIVINWAGGLHHAKKSEASGFCYVNDIVLAILELLKKYTRVLYIDIDIHHGDGVEEAFYCTNRVMTVSFHKHKDYFPGTGDIDDIGWEEGKGYAVNFPLDSGMDDESYVSIFKPVIKKVMETYQPEAIVLQCGADSLSGDRLGCFNLSLKGHGECVNYVRQFNKPMLVLGGGGYTIRNVSRCWTYETSIVLGKQIDNVLPFNNYSEYFGPDYSLHIKPSNMRNSNSTESLNNKIAQIYSHLDSLEAVPGIQIETGSILKTPEGTHFEKEDDSTIDADTHFIDTKHQSNINL
ncbi:hypothetical protein WA158_005017 [Blastocystis sp. Blastoise]